MHTGALALPWQGEKILAPRWLSSDDALVRICSKQGRRKVVAGWDNHLRWPSMQSITAPITYDPSVRIGRPGFIPAWCVPIIPRILPAQRSAGGGPAYSDHNTCSDCFSARI